MKEHLIRLVGSAASPVQGRNLAREYLQARILAALQQAGAMTALAFHGGTALRFLYGAARFSEDLDFALERFPERYDLNAYAASIQSTLVAEGFDVEMKVSDRRVVNSAFIRFHGLPHVLGLSPHADEVLAVKLEIDTNPPAGATLQTSIVRRHATLHLQHHDRASLFAGKLHAILQRPYAKGRDIYDLVWYLADRDWPPPNLALLNNALRQTGWPHDALNESSWRTAVAHRLHSLDWKQVVTDVSPFLESTAEVALLTLDNVMALLGETQA